MIKRVTVLPVLLCCAALGAYALPTQLSAGLTYLLDASHMQDSSGNDEYTTAQAAGLELGYFYGETLGSYICAAYGYTFAMHIADTDRSEFIAMSTYTSILNLRFYDGIGYRAALGKFELIGSLGVQINMLIADNVEPRNYTSVLSIGPGIAVDLAYPLNDRTSYFASLRAVYGFNFFGLNEELKSNISVSPTVGTRVML